MDKIVIVLNGTVYIKKENYYKESVNTWEVLKTSASKVRKNNNLQSANASAACFDEKNKNKNNK